MLALTKSVAAALEKRCDAWHLRLDKLSFQRNGGPEAKTKALKEIRKTYNNQRGALDSAAQSRLHWLDRLKHQHGDRFGELTLALDSRLLLHLGRANVLENVGLYCDHTTGLPLIPGTALKGLVSTWACWEANQDRLYEEQPHLETTRAALARRILGDNSRSGSEGAGDVIFVGGFPITPPRLGLDIVNPHHEPDGRAKARLTPNTFLCIEPGTLWRFVFFVRAGVDNAASLLQQTHTWLEEALTQIGIGAKTAAGYGRFREPTEDDLEAQKGREAQAKAAKAEAAKKAQAEEAKAAQQATAQATLKSDYPNEVYFNNRVLSKLNPGQLENLKSEIPLLKKAANQAWCERLKRLLARRDYREIRNRLRSNDWFPAEWLPPQ
jgi:CRISPR type III-B/RAMP module RAMP protein Cmr6